MWYARPFVTNAPLPQKAALQSCALPTPRCFRRSWRACSGCCCPACSSSISGLLNSSVPRWRRVHVGVPASFERASASPKSARSTRRGTVRAGGASSGSKRTLSHFKSKWTTPVACRSRTAHATCGRCMVSAPSAAHGLIIGVMYSDGALMMQPRRAGVWRVRKRTCCSESNKAHAHTPW